MHLVTETRPQVKRDRLLPLPDVEIVTGTKKSTIYKLIKEGQFPPPVQITARRVAWPESRVLQWVQERIAAADRQLTPQGESKAGA